MQAAGQVQTPEQQQYLYSSVFAGSEDLSQSLEARVQEFTLSNGLHFIVLERRIAPIVSCHTYADVGAFDEVDGQTGAYDAIFILWQQLCMASLVSDCSCSCRHCTSAGAHGLQR